LAKSIVCLGMHVTSLARTSSCGSRAADYRSAMTIT
jgi:hypothetical protein